MSAIDTNTLDITPKFFKPLEQKAFQSLEQSAFLKGLLIPFKGKGELEHWARQCERQRDQLIHLSQERVLKQTQCYPFALLPVHLAQQSTGTGTVFLRWRNLDRSAMGVELWQEMMLDVATPSHLIIDLYAIEQQRIVLNMQIGLLHSLARRAWDCVGQMANADAVFVQRAEGGFVF